MKVFILFFWLRHMHGVIKLKKYSQGIQIRFTVNKKPHASSISRSVLTIPDIITSNLSGKSVFFLKSRGFKSLNKGHFIRADEIWSCLINKDDLKWYTYKQNYQKILFLTVFCPIFQIVSKNAVKRDINLIFILNYLELYSQQNLNTVRRLSLRT